MSKKKKKTDVEETTTALLEGRLPTKRLKVKNCIPNPWNPNRMDSVTMEKLGNLIDKMGFIVPIVVSIIQQFAHYRSAEFLSRALTANAKFVTNSRVLKPSPENLKKIVRLNKDAEW